MHFQQTNVTPGFIPESVGGFFEFIKGRVVIPGNGDLNEFRHVIRHELVHVFMHTKIANVLARYDKIDGAYPPLWFTEGLAEYWSTEWDAQAEMVLQDAVLNNYVVGLHDMYQINGTFAMYKIGQDVLNYISIHFGEDKLLRMMESVWKYPYFEQCFQEVLGMDYKEFDHQYLYHLKNVTTLCSRTTILAIRLVRPLCAAATILNQLILSLTANRMWLLSETAQATPVFTCVR